MHSLRTAIHVTQETIRLNPLRGVLSTLGVIIGVASLVAVLSLGDGMERTAREQLAQTTDLQTLAVNSRMEEEIEGQSFPLVDTLSLGPADVVALRTLPGVAAMALVARAAVEVRSADTARQRRRAALMAVTPDFFQIGKMELLAGRTFSAADSGPSQAAAILSRQLARDFAGDDGARVLGDSVLVAGVAYRVVGVLAGELGRVSRSIIVPFFPGISDALGARPLRYPSLVVRAARVDDIAALENGLRRHFAAGTPSQKPAVVVQSYRARADQAAQGILIFKLLMGAITGISLIVGGIGIMNVLLASVSERTREIGIRKATGARHRDILYQFLAESVAITAIGSVIGVVLGLSGAFAITSLIRRFADAVFIQASFTWSSVLIAAALTISIGLAFGTYPARRAAGLSPIDAIRHE
jgi:putative ABC transport system permease protein